MKDISIRSTPVLIILGLIAIGLMLLVEQTKHEQTQDHFQEKMKAARLMQQSIDHLKATHFKDEVAVDNINDPNDTRIIGTRFSSITSGRGSLPIKLSTANPNFAALVVQLFKDAGVRKGDHVAIGATGSFPALNIAACAAAEVLEVDLSLITSVTSSSWGANDPNFTFLDMHTSLQKAGLFTHQILASSIGANQDIGRTLSREGRDDARKAVARNEITFINEGSLTKNIQSRIAQFETREQELAKEIILYVNIGGGVASLGSDVNSASFPSGLTQEPKLDLFADKTGMMFHMASKGVPIINLKNIQVLMTKYELPRDPVPMPLPGEGKLFYDLKYNVRYVLGATALLVFLIVGVILYDRHQNALGKAVIKTPENHN